MEDRGYKRRNKPREQSENMIYGIHAVMEAAREGKEFERLYIQDGIKNELIRELKTIIREKNIPYLYVPQEKINRLAANRNHQGVVGFLSVIEYQQISDILPRLFEDGETPLILVLDRITDVRNFGAICRTAECSGVHAVVIPARGAAQVNADSIKTSAGALNKIPVCRENNLKETLDYLSESGLQIISCTEKADDHYFDPNYTKPTAIILGSEEDGISPEYIKRSDQKVSIPMAGTIGSLNVSVAAGIVLFEVLRQRLVVRS